MLTARGPAQNDHRHAAFWEDTVKLQPPAVPEDEQPTRQFLQPGLETVPEAPHKALTGLVEVWHIGVIDRERIVLAGLALEIAPAERAVELLSGAEAALAELQAPLAPVDAMQFEQDRARGKASVDGTAWARADASGRQLTVSDALALARSMVLADATNKSATAASRATSLLSPRELQVADLIAKGLSNRQLATALTISEKTAANHVEHIMTKLDLRSRAQIAVWAVQQHHPAAHA